MSEEEIINAYNQKKYDEALKEVENKEFSLMLENYKKIVQIPLEEYQDLTKEEPKENFQYMVHKMANEDIKIFESLELKDKLIKLQEEQLNKQKEILDKIKEYVENLLKEEFEITDPDNINYGQKCQKAYFSDSELGKILELLEEIE